MTKSVILYALTCSFNFKGIIMTAISIQRYSKPIRPNTARVTVVQLEKALKNPNTSPDTRQQMQNELNSLRSRLGQ